MKIIKLRFGHQKPFGAEHVNQVLERIGLEKADIESISKLPDDAKDFKPEDYAGKVAAGYENKLMNDTTFLGKLTVDKLPNELKRTVEAGQYGRFMNEFKALAVKQGIDIADLSEEDAKSLNKTVTKVFEKYAGKLGSSEAVTKLQNDLQKALHDKSEIETALPTKLSDLEKRVKGEMQTTIKKLIASNELANNKNLKVKASLVIDSLLNRLENKYSLVNEGTEIFIRQKENPQLKVTDSAGKELTFAEALKAEGVAEDLFNPETVKPGEESGNGVYKITVNGDSIQTPGYIAEKLKRSLEIEKKF